MTKKNTKRTSRADAVLSDEEFQKALEEYKQKRAAKTDAEDVDKKVEVEVETPEGEFGEVEKKVAEVKERRDRRDEQGDPKDVDEAMGMIAHQDEDLDTLFDLIDTLLAKLNFDAAEEEKKVTVEEEIPAEEDEFAEDEIDDLDKLKGDADDVPEDEEDEEFVEDAEDEELPEDEEEEEPVMDDEDEEVEEEVVDEEVPEDEEDEFATDEDDEEDECGKKVNMDSIDRIVSEKLSMDKLGEAVGISGLGHKSIGYAKRAIIKRVRPGIRLDGKSDTYIDACFDMAKNEIKKNSKKDTSYQKRQMYNKNARMDSANSGSDASRRKMVKRQMNHK